MRLILGGAVYQVDDLVELLEYRLQTNTNTEEEFEFYTAIQRYGNLAFRDRQYTGVILGLMGGVI